MDGYTKTIWDFMEAAFRTGTLDKILDLVNLFSGTHPKDLAQTAADLEDVFIEMDDTGPMEEKFGRTYEALEMLTDDDVLEGIGILLDVVTPVISKIVQQTDSDPFSPEKQAELKEKIGKMIIAFKVIGSIAVKNVKASLSEKSAEQIGHDIGRSINSTSTFVNSIYDKNNQFFSDLMSGIFNAVDRQAYMKMNLILADGLMEQKPPLFKFTSVVMRQRARKNLLKKLG